MTKIKPCPCGKTPNMVYPLEYGQKWTYVVGDCCGEWHVEAKTRYKRGQEARDIALQFWNESPRGL